MVVVETGETWIVLNKPAGLPVFPLHADPDSDCLLKRLLEAKPEQAQAFPKGFEGGIAHRLDIPTSGMIIAARTPVDLEIIRSHFTLKRWSKKYLFISHKRSEWTQIHSAQPIAHHPKSRKKMVVQRNPHTRHRGKWYPAETGFQYLGPCELGHLYQATMRSGVMHQIRVHAAACGVPLLGDQRYGGAEAPPCFEAEFALHHCGMNCEAIQTRALAHPSWWPKRI